MTSRRLFLGAAAGALCHGAGRPLEPLTPGIKISLQIPNKFTDEDLTFAKQLGVGYVSIPGAGGDYAYFANAKKRVEGAGLKVANMGNSNVHNMPEVTLNLPGRDAKIEEYQQYLRNLSRAGIYYTTYAHMGNGIWSSERGTTRGGGLRRAPSSRRTRRATGWARSMKARSRMAAGTRPTSYGTTTPIS